ncbi:hypothetical protein KC340_g4686 [Hortaea werneckii]|uniref:RNA polymerase II degradation factor 1 n=1 Tax=Hortaea werneckii EXF-2000 TaxID=1157616 RepID=A0A1Z5TQ73_HORWE|nr:hypothetical protein KC342_g5084 [Hortaea werneckii]OTA38129.1 hypothetical protein BTJ68_02039 [Hortaea werneckii EXF-2000]KAI7100409.1 hypothetical protein KC339_g7513 [Hortaea werneckii]KAI7243097.1 hypothetical protein KC365_g2578 [Hortaea werneckii]KAI7329390.1 hypothetical protein KC340_g4686 [Hortaea werneckii]
MSEVEARAPPSRGRSSTRGGRGGFGRGGPRGGRKPINGASDAAQMEESLEDQGELGEVKKKFSSELGMLRDMFPDWTDTDLVFALQESDGDVGATVDKITQGNVSQFAEVKKPKDRARSKAKEEPATGSAIEKPAARGGRGRGGFDSTRGGRGRASDRGRGGLRGGRGGHATTNGPQKDVVPASIPTNESAAWDTTTTTAADLAPSKNTTADAAKEPGQEAGQSSWGNVVTSESTPATASEGMKSSLIPDGGPKKSWASMFSQPKPAPAPVVPKQAPIPSQPPPAELVASGEVPSKKEEMTVQEAPKEPEPVQPAPAIQETPAEPVPAPVPTGSVKSDGPLPNAASTKVPLTEENVEHLPDESHAPATQTVASTTGSIDTRNLTPLPNQQAPIGSRPPMGGYAATAYRATGAPGRSPSFQRRVQEQQEAVVMPGHNAVDRAAVQFGSMGLNGEPGPDVDEDREEPETQKALQPSPPAQPRTSLPPAPKQEPEAAIHGGLPTPKQAPGLPPASQQNQQQMQQQMQDATMAPGLTQDQQHMNPNYAQYGRYGQGILQQDSGAQQQKPYDPFSHQAQPNQFDQYAQQAHPQQPSHAGFGGLSSAPTDYSSYYTSNEQRNAYNQYYGSSYGPQDVRSQAAQQDTMGPQRSTSGFGAAAPTESPYASQQQAQSRFGDAPGSGHTTPNPLMASQQQQVAQQTAAAQQAQQAQQSAMQAQASSHQQQAGGYGAGAGYPYGHPYYNSPYQAAYQNQFGFNHAGLGGYGGGGFPGKQAGMYGAPGGYGMGSHSAYDQHSASPANASAFGQNQATSMRSASGMSTGLSSGLDDYGRNSMQSAASQQGSAFGMNDPFARSASGFGGQPAYGQQSMAAQEESLKPFADSTKSGPSPALGQPGRPGSAANSAVGSTHGGLPPPGSNPSGFGGGYPGFPGSGSQYGGLGGLGQQAQSGMGGQAGGYGGYGAGGFGQAYGAYGSRGGWGSNYGAH